MVRMRVEGGAEQRRSRWAVFVPWLLVVVLAFANVASLVNARFHAVGFRAVEAVLTTLGGNIAESVLKTSPTRLAARERLAFAKASAVARSVAKRTTTRLAVHSAESVTGVPARVLPFVGVAAIVTMTAYDVQSDCATINEINEVLGALDAPVEDPGPVCRYVSKVPSVAEAWASAKSRASAVAAKVMGLAERAFNR